MTVDVDVPPGRPSPFGGLDPADVGRAHRAIDPLHSQVYFAPDAEAAFVAAGLRPGRMPYFAGRAAPMGAVGPGVVAATFYNFNPELVARFIPRAWTLVPPERVVQVRWEAAATSLRRLLGEDVAASPEVAELGGLLRTATAACRPEGRPLYAGHADLEWPTDPLLVLWHATTLLREHRGDGHLGALAAAGLSGVEAIVTHTATGRGFRVEAAKQLRGWSDEQWSVAQDALRERGILDADDGLTAEGAALRRWIEDRTDELAAAPWAALGAEGTARVIALAKPLTRLVVAHGAFPDTVFAGPRS